MANYTQPEIQNLATQFRRATDTLDRKDWGAPWKRHPRGSCDVAHQTLAKIIHDQFGVSPNVVPGQKHNPHKSHVWLELDDFIIDVTGDEKGALVTKDRSGHEDWEVDTEKIGPVYFGDGWWAINCGKAYADITKHLKQLEGGGNDYSKQAKPNYHHVGNSGKRA